MFEDNREFVGVGSFKAFMNVELKYSLTIMNPAAQFYNMLMKL